MPPGRFYGQRISGHNSTSTTLLGAARVTPSFTGANTFDTGAAPSTPTTDFALSTPNHPPVGNRFQIVGIVVSNRTTSITPPTITVPVGVVEQPEHQWTLIRADQGEADNDLITWIYWRRTFGGTDEPATHTFTMGEDEAGAAFIAEYQNAPIVGSIVYNHNGAFRDPGQSVIAPNVQTLSDNLVLGVWGTDAPGPGTAGVTWTAPASMTERAQASARTAGILLAEEAVATNGATGTRTATHDGSTDDPDVSTAALVSISAGGSSTFLGDREDVTEVGQIVVYVTADVDSADNGLEIQFSTDGTNFEVFTQKTHEGGNDPTVISLAPQARFFRVRYENGTQTQGFFRLQTMFLERPTVPDEVVIAGRTPEGGTDTLELTADSALRVADERLETGTFGALATDARIDEIEVEFIGNTIPTDLVETTTTASATVTQTDSQALVASTGGDTTASAIITSRSKVRYRAGHEVMALFTAAWETPGIANSTMLAGLYDDDNGVFLGYVGTDFVAGVRRGGTDTTVSQTSWNPDTLLGSDLSRFERAGSPEAIDFTKVNVFRIRFGWLGSAPVVYEVLSPDGKWIEFHRVRQPNLDIDVQVLNPNLPMRMEVTKTGAATTDLQMRTGSWAGSVRGIGHVNFISSENTTATPLSAAATFTGDWISIEHHASIVVAIHSDQSSASQGLKIDFCNDTTGPHRTVSFTYDTPNTGQVFAVGVGFRYMRVRYINGGVDQTEFELETTLLVTATQNPLVPATAAVLDDQTTVMARSVLTGKKPDTSYGNVGLTASNNLDINIAEAEVPVPILALTAFATNGVASVGTTPSQIASGLPSTVKTISFKANPANTKVIYLGNSASVGVVSGYPLAAGDSVELEVDNTPNFWVRSESGTQTVHWLYVTGSP